MSVRELTALAEEHPQSPVTAIEEVCLLWTASPEAARLNRERTDDGAPTSISKLP
jgi:hypothetical protein